VNGSPAGVPGRFARVLTLSVALAACAPAGSGAPRVADAGGAPIEPVVLLESNHSMFDVAERLVIKDSVGWREALNRVHSVPPEAAAVDFDRSMVLLVSAGARNSGGFGIKVVAVRRYADRIEAVVRTVIPGTGCIVTGAFTHPVQAVAIPRTTLPVRFIEETMEIPCTT